MDNQICNDWGRFWDAQNRPQSLHARENGLFKDICPRMVESAVDILEEMEI